MLPLNTQPLATEDFGGLSSRVRAKPPKGNLWNLVGVSIAPTIKSNAACLGEVVSEYFSRQRPRIDASDDLCTGHRRATPAQIREDFSNDQVSFSTEVLWRLEIHLASPYRLALCPCKESPS